MQLRLSIPRRRRHKKKKTLTRSTKAHFLKKLLFFTSEQCSVKKSAFQISLVPASQDAMPANKQQKKTQLHDPQYSGRRVWGSRGIPALYYSHDIYQDVALRALKVPEDQEEATASQCRCNLSRGGGVTFPARRAHTGRLVALEKVAATGGVPHSAARCIRLR